MEQANTGEDNLKLVRRVEFGRLGLFFPHVHVRAVAHARPQPLELLAHALYRISTVSPKPVFTIREP